MECVAGGSGQPKGRRSCSPGGGDLGYHTLLPAWPNGASGHHQPPVQSQRPPRCLFDRLPDDLLLRVLACLSSDELCRCARVCRRWYFLAWEPRLWTSIVLGSEHLPVDQGAGGLLAGLCPEAIMHGCWGYFFRVILLQRKKTHIIPRSKSRSVSIALGDSRKWQKAK